MSLNELIENIKRNGLKQTVVTIGKDAAIEKEFKDYFKPNIWDSFNSRCANLADYEAVSLDDALRIFETYSTENFLLDVLPMGILALTKETKGIEGVWRYEITEILEGNKLGLDKGIKSIVIAEPTNKIDNTDKVNYFRNQNKPKENDTIGQNKKVTKTIQGVDIFGISDCYDYGLKGGETHRLYGNIIPQWLIRTINSGTYPILRDDRKSFNPGRGVREGDIFNAIMMNSSPKERNGDKRIFQFMDEKSIIGYVRPFDPGVYDVKSVSKGDLHVGFVYRFEVFFTKGKRGHEFHCRPIELITGEDAINVNYKKEKYVELPTRQKFEYISGKQYRVGISHLEKKGNATTGIFFDALLPNFTGIAFFHENDLAYIKQFENGGFAMVNVTRVKPSNGGNYLVLSDFVSPTS